MIGQLRGILREKQPPQLLLDVQGVGYEISAPMTTFYDLPAVGDEIRLHTHLVVREDAHTLYGFLQLSDRTLFRTLIKVNGVGAKLALTILSGMSAENFVACVQEQNSVSLTRLPGVGKKTAERLVVELKDRLGDFDAGSGSVAGASAERQLEMPKANPVEEAVGALVALGYKPNDASRMVRSVPAEGLGSEQIIRQALKDAVR